MFALRPEYRQAIAEHGTPLALTDKETGEAYVLLPIDFEVDPESAIVAAHTPGISAYGEGESQKEAVAALMAALNGYINAFGD